MKIHTRRRPVVRYAILLVGLWFTSTAHAQTLPALQPDPAEPNDTVATARTVPRDEPFEFWIAPVGDRDVFRVDAPEAGYLWASYSRAQFPLQLVPEWLDAQGRVIGTGWIQRVAAGPVYLRLRDRWESYLHESPRAIYGTVSFLPEADPSEPNDTWDTARAVALNAVVTMHLLPAKDVDYLRFEVPEHGTWTASLVMAPQGPHDPSPRDYRGMLYDAAHRAVQTTNIGAYAISAELEPGTYFLKMDRTDDEPSGFEPVQVALDFVSPHVAPPRDPTVQFTLIGLGEANNAAQQQQFRALADALGGRYVPVEHVEDIQREFARAVHQPRRFRWWLWGLIGAVAVALWWRAKGERHAR